MDTRNITPEMARRELARRELEKRGASLEQKDNSLTFGRGAKDILSGVAEGAENIVNTPYNLTNAISPKYSRFVPHLRHMNYSENFGINNENSTLADKLIQGLGQYAPAFISPEAELGVLGKGIGKIPYAGKWLSKSISGGAPAATYSATQNPEHPVEAAALGLGTGFVSPILKSVKQFPLLEKNIVNDVLNTKNKLKGEYGERYTSLSNEAKSRGADFSHINPENIDIETIKKYSPEKTYSSLDKFLEDRNMENAQRAISDLGYTERKLGSKTSLNSEERAQLNAIKDAKNHIQENMFKDKNGDLIPDLLDKYKKLQEGYRKEVIPYTTNKDIKAYEAGEKTKSDLISALEKGKFAAQRGDFHKAIGLRKTVDPIVKGTLASGGVGAGLYGAKKLYDALMGSPTEGNE